jgi:hypothetical protein
VFLPAEWTVPQNPFTFEGCGLGGIVSGLDFSAPVNPVIAAQDWTPISGVPLDYSYPSNGVVEEIQAKQALALELTKNPNGPVGLSCGCSGNPGCVRGLGDLSTSLDSLLNSVTSSFSSGSWQTWAMAGAAVVALVMFTGGGGAQRHSEIAAAKAKYRADVARIKAERPRRYQKFV